MIIETQYGKIKGKDHGWYQEFRGVPYAKAPVGELRFKAPQPLEHWDGVYDATEKKSMCMQMRGSCPPWEKDFFSDTAYYREMSEDCLHMEIWAPSQKYWAQEKGMLPYPEGESKPEKPEKYPVAFWIHGGAFINGNSSEIEFDGLEYCRRGVILVSITYRCNMFGFLAHPWLSAENEQGISGNYGILDQIAALKWVYDNIEHFGGDPDNITIFGQSAGAMSVHTLLCTELTGNMIAKAIMQSGGSYGTGLHRVIDLKKQEEYGQIFTDLVGAKSLEELREMDADKLMSYQDEYFDIVRKEFKDFFLIPTVDQILLTAGHYELMDQGRMKDVPMLLGSVKDDILRSDQSFDEKGFCPLYYGVEAFGRKLKEMGRDGAYLYYFAHDLPGDQQGAWHSCDLWYTFGTLGRCWRPWKARDYEISSQMLDYWTNFMKYGNPNGDGLPVWNAYDEETKEIFVIE